MSSAGTTDRPGLAPECGGPASGGPEGGNPARLARLDGLRGLAAVVVALHHVFLHYAPWPYAPGPLGAVARWITVRGWTLVDLFFILSGFVFAHVYLATPALASGRARADFVVARIARLYPLHLAALITFALIDSGNPGNTVAAFVGHLTLLLAFYPSAGTTYDWAAWSLSVEAVCYAIFLVAASGGRRVMVPATALFAALGAGLLARYGASGDPTVADMMRRGLMGFFVGQAMWLGRAWLTRLPTALLLAALVAGFGLQTVGGVMPVLPLGLLAWPAALLLALRWRWLGSSALVWLGDRSYAIYLLNLVVIVGARDHLAAGGLSAPVLAVAELAMIAAILVLSDWSCRWLERPARRAIRAAWAARAAGSSARLAVAGRN
ncbi:acyltransferase family protein [Novosphingobium bradum]|uniref:Acyltransferase family protein n=1 Tax=Novosphingobium bradum TaxID=1737444 RepID=A0ABV7IQC9_9SPHN